ncbi:hypothetical protein V5E97_05280 [Singulisphaera sp. Ch08]|uniref:Uncharacterized protein n=1 Tax=Singulisphaera sp. Ch08 TaxID=3120278 RepID=A0AAU7CKH1_9BACT
MANTLSSQSGGFANATPNTTLERTMVNKPKPMSVWLPFGFSAILCVIVLIANVVGGFVAGRSDIGMTPLICFLPMIFWVAAASHQQTNEHIKALEDRIRQLEEAERAV